MKTRCYNSGRPGYKYYGGRGIGVCRRWLDDFFAFVADMGEKPSPAHQIDRIDPDGDYCPENCRWVLPVTQQRNRRKHLFLTHNGETLPCSVWSERTGIPKDTLRKRVTLHGMSHEDAITRPLNAHRGGRKGRIAVNSVPITWAGETLPANEWARRLGFKRGPLLRRIREWGLEAAMTTERKHP